MQHINHSLAAAFLQDVWLDWLRHLQDHNTDFKYFIAIYMSQNIQIVRLLWLMKILAVKTKENYHSLYLKGASCVEKDGLRGWSIFSAPCWQRLITVRNKDVVQVSCNFLHKKRITDVCETPTCLLHSTALPNWDLLEQHQDLRGWGKQHGQSEHVRGGGEYSLALSCNSTIQVG